MHKWCMHVRSSLICSIYTYLAPTSQHMENLPLLPCVCVCVCVHTHADPLSEVVLPNERCPFLLIRWGAAMYEVKRSLLPNPPRL